jgi:FAD:protein FMN transferase
MTPNGPKLTRRDALRISAVTGVAALAGGGLVADLVRRAGLHRISVSKARLGTLVGITVVHPDEATAREMVADAFAEIDRLDALLSRHRPDTPLALLNRVGRVEGAAPELLHVLRAAQDCAHETDGAFDPTVAPLVDLYRKHFARSTEPPSRSLVGAAMAKVGHQALWVGDDAAGLDRPGMAVTLDGIAKGYVVDATVAVLARAGAERVMVDAGGDIASGGPGSVDEPWRIGLQDPLFPDRLIGTVSLDGRSVATSGDYMQAYSTDRRFNHLIDPRTGYSPDHTSGVSVVANSAMEADALSTSALVLGPVAGLAFLEGTPGVEGMIVGKDGSFVVTSGMPAA